MQRTVKQVATSVGFPSRTVRYYDRIGLVSPSARSEAGYRLYDAHDEGKLSFVRHAKALGLSLQEIRELIAAAESGSCGQVVPELERLLHDKVDEIDQRIRELQAFRRHLVDYADGNRASCDCQSHGAFCGCLNDVPLPDDKGTTMTCTCCSTEGSATSEPETGPDGATPGPGCGCGDSCNCASGDPLTAEAPSAEARRSPLQPQA